MPPQRVWFNCTNHFLTIDWFLELIDCFSSWQLYRLLAKIIRYLKRICLNWKSSRCFSFLTRIYTAIRLTTYRLFIIIISISLTGLTLFVARRVELLVMKSSAEMVPFKYTNGVFSSQIFCWSNTKQDKTLMALRTQSSIGKCFGKPQLNEFSIFSMEFLMI